MRFNSTKKKPIRSTISLENEKKKKKNQHDLIPSRHHENELWIFIFYRLPNTFLRNSAIENIITFKTSRTVYVIKMCIKCSRL